MNESHNSESLHPIGKNCSFYICTSVASFSLCLFMFYFVSPRFSSLVSSGYHKLPHAKTINWDTRIGSNVHAVIVSTISLYCFFFDTETTLNPIKNDAVLVRVGVAITMGYILAGAVLVFLYNHPYKHFAEISVISDFLIIALFYKCIGDLFTLAHHVMAIWAYYFVVVYGVLIYFANVRQLAEISTPFVNQRWFLDAVGHPRTSFGFVINGYVMGASFFLCRILIMPIYYYKCYSVWGSEEQRNLGFLINFFWIFTCIVLDAINLYWFAKIVKGAMKLTRKMKNHHE